MCLWSETRNNTASVRVSFVQAGSRQPRCLVYINIFSRSLHSNSNFPRHLSSHPCSNVSTNVLLLCHHCQCNLVVASSHPFASTNISSSFPAFHPLPVHCNSGVFLSRIFSLAPTFSFPFHLPPLQLGDCFVSHRFARSDIPPSPAQPSTTPTAVLDRFIA